MHALAEFLINFKTEAMKWYTESNSIVFLCTENENTLLEFVNKIKSKNIKYSEFREPDLNNQLTAICIEPSSKTKKLCYHFKLALKE